MERSSFSELACSDFFHSPPVQNNVGDKFLKLSRKEGNAWSADGVYDAQDKPVSSEEYEGYSVYALSTVRAPCMVAFQLAWELSS